MIVSKNFLLKILAISCLVLLLAIFSPAYQFPSSSARAQEGAPVTDTQPAETVSSPTETPVPTEATPIPSDAPAAGEVAQPSATETSPQPAVLSQPLMPDAATETPSPTPSESATATATVSSTNSTTPEGKMRFSTAQLQKLHGQGGPDKMFERMKEKGRLKVIVGLDVAFTPLGKLSPSSANIVKTNIGKAQTQVAGELAGKDVRHLKNFEFIPYMAMDVDEQALNALIASGKVTSIIEDKPMRVSLDQSVPRIGGTTAWTRGYDGSGVTVAILDTGVDKTHPFLSGAVVSEACYSYTGDGSTSICPGGVQSSTAVGSAMPYAGVCPAGECHHGTHVAGIAVGRPGPFAGVARNANIIAIQVFSRFETSGECGGTAPCAMAWIDDQITGLERVYALRNTYNIAAVNLSLGGGGYSSQAACDTTFTSYGYKQAIDNLRTAGIATVISSGNDGFTNALSGPGCISSAISVGATTDADEVASYSNSASFLDLLAPGSSINSSIPGPGYASWDGTSMAAPHVTGAWALLKQAESSATVSEVLNALTTTGVLKTKSGVTKPRINVNNAINYLGAPAGPGTYDDTDTNIVYSGSWAARTYTGMYNNTYHFSTTIGDTASFTFNGEGVNIVYYKQSAAYNYGTVTVHIDGVEVGTIDMLGTSLQIGQIWTSGALAPGDHVITLTHATGTNVDLDAIIVTGPPPTATNTPLPVGLGTYDDTHTNVVYSGSWVPRTYTGMYNNTYHYSTTIGDTASLTFTGESVSVVYYKQSGYGTVTVRIDGVDVGTINMAGTSLQIGQIWTSGTLSSGDHTLTLVHSAGGTVDLDAITVSGPPPTATNTPTASNTPSPTATLPPVGVGMYDNTHTNVVYSGNWAAKTYTGMYNNTYHYSTTIGDTASLTFTGEGVTVVFFKQSGYGTVTVRIDGVDVGTINMAGTSLQIGQTWTSGTLSSGDHTLTLVHATSGYVDLDAITVSGPPPTAMNTPTATNTPLPVGLGTYDNTHTNVVYSGNWAARTYTGMYNNTYHYSTTIGDTASLTFTGEGVTVVFFKQSGYGTVTVRIDGVDVGTINMASTSLQIGQTWKSGTLSSGDHTLTLVHSAGGTVDLDAITVTSPPTPTPTATTPPQIVDDGNVSITYTGAGWKSFDGIVGGPQNGTGHYTNANGDSLSFSFSGVGIRLLYMGNTNRADAQIQIDGVSVATLDQSAAGLQWQREWTSPALSSGAHTITITHTGTAGLYLDIDALAVYP